MAITRPYTAHEWETGDVITEERMNTIEKGIEAIDTEVFGARGYGTSSDNSLGSRIDDMIIISDSEPTSVNNEIWVNPTNTEYVIPTNAEFEHLRDSVAAQYSDSATYAIGDYVLYDNMLYRCSTAIKSAESWTAAHWTKVTVANEVADLKNDLKLFNNAIYQDPGNIGISRIISATGVWHSSGEHISIIVNAGDHVRVLANNSFMSIYGVLRTDNSYLGNSTVVDFSQTNGFTERFTLQKGTETTFIVPEDATVLCFTSEYNNNIYTPAKIEINGFDALIGLQTHISELESSSENIKQIFSIIADEFVTTKNYTPVDYVWYNERLYHFISVHAAGAWTGNDVEEVTIAEIERGNVKHMYHVLPGGTDLDTVKYLGIYRLSKTSTYVNNPLPNLDTVLIALSTKPTATGNVASCTQILINGVYGTYLSRLQKDQQWSDWSDGGYNDELIAIKRSYGLSPSRKAIDHGGIYTNKAYEDSPLAFLNSAKEGIVYHNLDIIFTSDGVPFVFHDITATDWQGNTVKPESLTAEQMKATLFGDSNYQWTPLTLAEMNGYIKSLGGIVDMVDISTTSGTKALANAKALPNYYRAHNIKPTWTNYDSENYRNAFIENGPEFGVYMVCSTAASIDTALSYIQNKPDTKFALNVMTVSSPVKTALENHLSDFTSLGVTLYAYLFNDVSNAGYHDKIPDWADGALSETLNVNYVQWLDAK